MSASSERLYFLLQRAAHGFKKRADAALFEAADLSTAQAAALAIIADDGPVSQRAVAAQLSQRESAVMTMTLRLIKAGYVTRSRSATDARAWELSITDHGRAALEKMQGPFSEINRLMDDTLEPQQLDEFAVSLKALIRALES